MHAVVGAPDVVVELSLWDLWRVVSSATEHPNAILEHRRAADQSTLRPKGYDRLHLFPVDAVLRSPNVTIKYFLRRRRLRNCLSAHDPNVVLKCDNIHHAARAPWHGLV